jgi:hypothetical protein
MSKRRVAAEAEHEPPIGPAGSSLPRWAKVMLSAGLLVHLLAVFIGPFAFASNSGGVPSPFADAAFQLLRPYIGALYLDHGYFFFAPNPGPSHLVDYRVEFDDGRPAVTGRIPDLAIHRPRLLYHRHFMLSEALSNRFVPPEPPPEPSPPPLTATAAEKALFPAVRSDYERQVAAWRHARRQYEAMRTSFEQHLLHQYGGSRVTLTRVEHRLPSADEVELAGRRLDDLDLYTNLPEAAPTESVR